MKTQAQAIATAMWGAQVTISLVNGKTIMGILQSRNDQDQQMIDEANLLYVDTNPTGDDSPGKWWLIPADKIVSVELAYE